MSIESPEPLETKEGRPQPSIILLDGSKGAGKTTVGEILVQRLKNTAFLSLDNERRALKNQDGPRAERNQEAFEKVLAKSRADLLSGTNVIIDCGLLQKRIASIESLAQDTGARVHKFLLKASYETQLERVRGRDASKGNQTDEARFAEVHELVHAKNFRGFTILDTAQLDPTEVAENIAATVA